MSLKLILIAGIIAKLYGNEDYYCCTSKIVGGIEYLLEGRISDPYEYDCLNGCIYTRIDGDPNIKYCFRQGPLPVECGPKDFGCNKNCSTCNRGSKDYVVSGDVYTAGGWPADTWGVQNLLTWSIPEVFPDGPGSYANYWIAPDGATGAKGEFVLRFDQSRLVDTITMVNSRNPCCNDRGTNEFKVYLADSEDGPWTEVLHGFLDDPRNTNATEASVQPQYFYLENPTCGQYVRFQIISFYGLGGGLQYFSTCPLQCEEESQLFLNKCYQKIEPENDIAWTDANFECNNIGGQLASIPNAQINAHIASLQEEKDQSYIGLIKSGPADDQWTWTDGTPFDYVDFGPGEPTGDGFCGDIWNDSTWLVGWNDVSCYTKYDKSFICQKYPTY